MKSVLFNKKPKEVARILNGEQSILISKVKPKLEAPYDGYLYCGKGTNGSSLCIFKNRDVKIGFMQNHYNYDKTDIVLDEKVVAKFTVNKVETIECSSYAHGYYSKDSRLTRDDFINLCNGKDLYTLHIDNLQIFDKPKNLNEFKRWVSKTIYSGMDCPPYQDEVLMDITKAPQNYCYCEVEENV